MTDNNYLQVLVKIIDKNDPYKSGHSERVAKLSEIIGLNLGLNESDISTLKAGALLHDIGKVLLPGDLWCIPDVVDREEKEIIEKHSQMGANLVQECELEPKIIDIVRYHHEWWNGNGYPQQLQGEDIPLMARIVALAEAYISMISYDIYSESLDKDEAVKKVKESRGEQFSPEVVDAFIKVMVD